MNTLQKRSQLNSQRCRYDVNLFNLAAAKWVHHTDRQTEVEWTRTAKDENVEHVNLSDIYSIAIFLWAPFE